MPKPGSVFLIFCCIALFGQKLCAQQKWNLESRASFGKIVRHNDILNFDNDQLGTTFGQEFNIKFQTLGTKEWHHWQKYPALGLALNFHHLGNNDLFGFAIGIRPNMNISILRKKNGFIDFQFGTGLAYLSKPFDYNDNPINNAIGSHWNNITAFHFFGGYNIGSTWNIHAGFGLTHYSNGAAQMPNYGINIPEVSLGLRYSFQPENQIDESSFKNKLNLPEKRWGFQMHLDLAYREYQESGGPRYPIYIGSVAGSFALNKVNRVLLGLEIEKNVGIYFFQRHLDPSTSEKQLRSDSRKIMVFAADEFLFGNVGVLLQLGTYIHRGEQAPFSVYNKLSVRYYLPPVGKPTTRFYGAIYLKSHISVAEYIAFGFGASF